MRRYCRCCCIICFYEWSVDVALQIAARAQVIPCMVYSAVPWRALVTGQIVPQRCVLFCKESPMTTAVETRTRTAIVTTTMRTTPTTNIQQPTTDNH